MKHLKINTAGLIVIKACVKLFFLCGIISCDQSNHDENTLKRVGIEHLVLFKFRQNITVKEKREVIRRFLALKDSRKNGAPYILSIEYGNQNSKEGVSFGYEVGFRVSFASEEDRDYYVGSPIQKSLGSFDPDHEAFKSFVAPYLNIDNGVLVFDYKPIK